MLKFIKISDSSNAITALSKRLTEELLKEKRVLWLISGGSNIPIEVAVMNTIPEAIRPYLAIMYDERYGKFGHPDSNLKQLDDAGFIPGKATLIPALTPGYASLKNTANRYNSAAETAFASADTIIAQLGLGLDGHVSGILPESPAASARKLVTGYKTTDFDRITFTFAALKKCTVAYCFAFGAAKRAQLEALCNYTMPPKIQPSQILKQIPEAYVYNDQIGE